MSEKFNLRPFVKISGVDVDTVRDAFAESIEALGSGYTPDYYWSYMAEALCRFYRAGRESQTEKKQEDDFLMPDGSKVVVKRK